MPLVNRSKVIEIMKAKIVDEEVVICRFGSVFATLTVMLLERRIHDRIQDEMKALDTERLLIAPKFEVGEKVCFKNNHGVWTRAHIVAICESEASEALFVDIVSDDTLETLRCVDSRALVFLPKSLRGLGNARLYFIDGLEPLKAYIGPKGSTAGIVGAQVSANALNKQWTTPPPGTVLVRVAPVPTINPAWKTHLQVATVKITRTLDLCSYIKDILSDHVISYYGDQLIRPPKHSWLQSSYGALLWCPFVSAQELCEVVSLRKATSDILEVGLRLSTYMDMGLLKVMLSERAKYAPSPISLPAGGALPISISENGRFQQRGVLFEDGRILGIDTLESFDPGSFETRILPYFMRTAFPHVCLFINWDISVRPRTPCIGDTIIVEDLKEDRGKPLHYSYRDVVFVDGPTVINYHPLKPREGESHPHPDKVVEDRKKSKQRKLKKSLTTLAEWYGLSGELPDVFKTALSSDFDPTLDALFAQHGVAVQLAAL